jgi:lantibiotic modifying enzyme
MHCGVTGIAFSAVVVGRHLDQPELVERGVGLAKQTIQNAGPAPLLDVISGSASAICAALVMSNWTGDRELLELADALGRGILDRAAERGPRWSWANSDCNGMSEWPRPLNGMAHGAAGLGVALLELYARTKTSAYRDAGMGAFAYEDQFITETDGNWMDLRVDEGEGERGSAHHCLVS